LSSHRRAVRTGREPGVTERHETQRQIITRKPLGVHAEDHDRRRQVTIGEILHLAAEAVLDGFGEIGSLARPLCASCPRRPNRDRATMTL
jgi:hypothetical protein